MDGCRGGAVNCCALQAGDLHDLHFGHGGRPADLGIVGQRARHRCGDLDDVLGHDVVQDVAVGQAVAGVENRVVLVVVLANLCMADVGAEGARTGRRVEVRDPGVDDYVHVQVGVRLLHDLRQLTAGDLLGLVGLRLGFLFVSLAFVICAAQIIGLGLGHRQRGYGVGQVGL